MCFCVCVCFAYVSYIYFYLNFKVVFETLMNDTDSSAFFPLSWYFDSDNHAPSCDCVRVCGCLCVCVWACV